MATPMPSTPRLQSKIENRKSKIPLIPLLAALLLSLPRLLLAAEPAEDKAKVEGVFKRVEAANEKFTAMTCDVKYTRLIPLLEEKQECKGTLRYLKPAHMELKLGAPRNEDVIADGERWNVVNHKDRQVEIYKIADNNKAAQEAAFLQFGYGGKLDDMTKSYKITLASEKKEGDVTLSTLRFDPKPQGTPTRFSRVETVISSKVDLPVTIKLYESDGEIVHVFDLSDIKLDVKLKKEDFKFEAPKGYAVVQPQ